MADGFPPAVDKVGAPETAAPGPRSGDLNTEGRSFLAVAPSAPANNQPGQLGQPDHSDRHEGNKIFDGAGPAVGAPKPVEVHSIPQTPMNGSTPAGGTPRPELKITEEPPPAKEPRNESVFLSGAQEPVHTPKESIPRSEPVSAPAVDSALGGSLNGEPKPFETSAPATHTGPAAEPVPAPAPPAHVPITGPVPVQDPRPAVMLQSSKPAEHAEPLKVNEPAAPPAQLGSTEPPKPAEAAKPAEPFKPAEPKPAESFKPTEPTKPAESFKPAEPAEPVVGEKRKFDSAEAAANVKPLTADPGNSLPLPLEKKPKVDDAPGETNNGMSAPKNGPGRPKKDKKAPLPVGRTTRKTRSQGPVDASG